MAIQIKANIELETGKKLTQYTRLVIDQPLFSHHRFELEVPFEILESKDEHFFHQAHKDVCGKTITISFEPILEKATFDFVFKGIVTEIALKNTSDLSNVFVIKGFSPTILLEDCQMRQIFLKKNIQQITETILSKYPNNLIKRKLEPKCKEEIAYSVQYDETNFQFLNRIAAENGEWLYYNGKELMLGEHNNSKAVDYEVNGIQTCDMSISLLPSKFKVSAYNYLQDETYKSNSSEQSLSGLGQLSSFAMDESENLFSQTSELLLTKPILNQQELDENTKWQRAINASNLIEFRGSGENPNLMVGSVIDVSGVRPKKDGTSKESFGKYRITEIIHEVDGSGNYSNSFRAIPEAATYPPKNTFVKTPVASAELAKVTDNDDPEKLGRVKVSFFWLSENKESDWMRVGFPYVSDKKGFVFVPEIGSQVMVAYENNRADTPYILTSLYHKTDEKYSSKDNSEKQFSMKGGNTIFFSDDGNKQFVEISNGKNRDKTFLKISFSDDGEITLKTAGAIKLEANDISLKAQNNISFEAQNNISMKATNSVEIEATAKMKLKGMELSMEADTKAELKANAELSLSSSAKASLSGGAMVEVQGAIIKLN